jgi:NADH-quinone oxidoreductase subunit N
MSAGDLINLLPLIILGTATILIMLIITIYRNHKFTLILTLIAHILSLDGLAFSKTNLQVSNKFLFIDAFATYYIVLLLGACIVTAVLSYSYMKSREIIKEEFYIFLLTATFGSAVLVSSNHLASFFLGLEILSVSLYVLAAYLKAEPIHIEAGIKYLIPAAVSTAFLLFGMALIFYITGTMELSKIADWVSNSGNAGSLLFLAGAVMLLTGIGFKLAAVPFHLWIPDVFEGAPAPVTGFLATVSKGSVFALLLRYFTVIDIYNFTSLFVAVSAIAILSMFFGNFLALLQNNVKRILAYSSIAHIGYLLVAFLASGSNAVEAVSFYLLAYFVTTLGAFGVITILSSRGKDLDKLEDYRGLVINHPLLAGVFTAMLLSLAGIPLTAGFIGKFYILSAGAGAGLWMLVIILVINSVIGLFYYLRVIITMFSRQEEFEHINSTDAESKVFTPALSLLSGIVLTALTLLLVWIGSYPGPFINLIKVMAESLS